MSFSDFCNQNNPQSINKFLLYKIQKIAKLTKKIKALTKKQGLAQRDVLKEIWMAFGLQKTIKFSNEMIKQLRLAFPQHIKERLLQQGNKLAVSVLQNLYRLYNDLKQKLASRQTNYPNKNVHFQRQFSLKLEQNQPSFLLQPKIYALSRQIKLQDQKYDSKINTFSQKNPNIEQQNKDKNEVQQKTIQQQNTKYFVQKLCKLRKKMIQHKKMQQKKDKQDQQECNRKYGPKIQTQRYNSNQWEQVKRLRERLLGSELTEKEKKKKRLAELMKKSNSSFNNPPLPYLGTAQRFRIRPFSF